MTLWFAGCRGSVKLYSDFYESDIIVASPLALATKLTEDEEEGKPLACHVVLHHSVMLFCKRVHNHKWVPQELVATVPNVTSLHGLNPHRII